MKNLLAAVVFLRLGFAAAPGVTKVEPPDWAAGPKATSLRLLATGRNLAGAAVRSAFHTGPVTISLSGTRNCCGKVPDFRV